MSPQITQRQKDNTTRPNVLVVAAGRVVRGQGIGISGKISKSGK